MYIKHTNKKEPGMWHITAMNMVLVLLAQHNLEFDSQCQHQLSNQWQQLGSAHCLLEEWAKLHFGLVWFHATPDNLMRPNCCLHIVAMQSLLL